MSDKKQPETEQPRRQNKGWPWVKGIIWPCVKGIIWIIMIALGGLSLFICWFYLSPEQRAANDHTALIVYLIGLAVTGGVVLCKPQIITSNPKKYFITSVLVTGITGGAFALLLPIAIKSTTTGVGGLRHSILLATGGLLAILTLGETRRKNDIDKDKSDKDHRRQVRADRRERYTKAVEQLGDEKAPVRIGGVYTLVGLVDEWLEDESIKKYEDRLKEGQVIINNLCAYIRSPFTLTSYNDKLSEDTPSLEGISKDKKEELYVDKAILDSEADVRLGIIKEIHNRLQGSEENTPGTWSDFEYDFSGSTFFYTIDLTNSYYAKPINFSGSTYQRGTYFSGSNYQGSADFSDSTYQDWANFSGSTYQWVDFSGSNYQGSADFSDSTYQDWANFNGSTYEGRAYFRDSTYKGRAYFRDSTYKGGANFHGSTYQWVDFSGSDHQGSADFRNSTYQGWAGFRNSTYQGWAYFHGSIYEGRADFRDSTYKGGANFHGSTYQWVDFSGSIYEGRANFSGSTYQGRANFSGSTYQGGANFSGSTYQGRAGFSGSTYQDWTDFRNSTYQAWADFSGSIYERRANFRNSTYQGGANFSGSTYQGRANFSGSTYQGGANFSGSTYQGRAYFIGSTYKGRANFSGSTYKGRAYFRDSNHKGRADFGRSTYQGEADFSGSIFYSKMYFGHDGDNSSLSHFTDYAPQFYDETNHKNTLFGSHNNDFTVDIDKGYPINLNSEGLPLGCKFLTSEQKEYLADKFQEIEKTNNKLLEAKDDEEKARLSDMLRPLYKELRKWREEATTVKAEDAAPREEDN